MSKVKVSPQLLKKAASEADQAGQAIGSVKMLEGTPSVAAAMPGSRSGGAVVRAADFGDKMAKSMKDSLEALAGALDKAREDYNAADHSSSVDFSNLDSRLRGK